MVGHKGEDSFCRCGSLHNKSRNPCPLTGKLRCLVERQSPSVVRRMLAMNKGPWKAASLSSEIHWTWALRFTITNDLVVTNGSPEVHLRVMDGSETPAARTKIQVVR